MLNHLISVEEASKIWGLSPGYVKKLCAEGQIVAKKIGKTWVVYRDQKKPNRQNQDYVKELNLEIEWNLMSSEERRAILDENSRIFEQQLTLFKSMKEIDMEESVIRRIFNLSDKELNELKEAAREDSFI